MSPDTVIIALTGVGLAFGVVLFVRLVPLATREGQLRRKRREIEELVSEREYLPARREQAPQKSRLTFGCLMKWLAALGLASWTAGLAAWAVYVIVVLVSLVLVLVVSGMGICLYLVLLRELL